MVTNFDLILFIWEKKKSNFDLIPYRVLKKNEYNTCAENPEEFLILSCCLQHFQDNSGKPMYQNCTTIKYKILTKHCNDPACLQCDTMN